MAMIGNFDDENSRSVFQGFLAMQRPEVENVFKTFIENESPSLIIEIGTAYGGLSKALNKIASEHRIKFITYDILENDYSKQLPTFGVDYRLENIFIETPSWSEYTLKQHVQEEFNQYYAPRLFLCDGGNKIAEYNALAKFVRPHDIIMAHDFAYDDAAAQRNLDNGVWAWAEIKNKDIYSSIAKFNLEYYQMETWEKLVWACTKKVG